MFHWLNGQAWFTAGANVLQFIGSIGLIGAAWHVWHNRCGEPLCVRPGAVPCPGSVHKLCKRHAVKHGVTHPA